MSCSVFYIFFPKVYENEEWINIIQIFLWNNFLAEILANLKKASKSSKSIGVEYVDKATQIPEEETEISYIEETEDLPKIGEPGWRYLELKPSEDLQVILATLWENAEDIYINDFSQVLFLKRILLDEYIPFIKFVKDHIKANFSKPNEKQILLQEFQKVYNIFDKDIRNDEEFKAEYHCR